MAYMTPPALVAGPVRAPLPFGIDSVVAWRGDGRFDSGIEWETDGCGPSVDGRGGPDCDPAEIIGLPKNLDATDDPLGYAAPFAVYGHYSCLLTGNTLQHAQDEANNALLAGEQYRVEQALWTGDLGNTPNLHDDGEMIWGGQAFDVRTGLAYLEWAIANNYGGLGVIHMTRGMALIGFSAQVITSRGGRLYTQLGTPVIAGAGYDGTGPEGSAALGESESWAYATPALIGYRSDILTSSSRPGDLLNRSNNQMTAIAERTYAVGYDPCGVAAVLLTLDLGVAGPAGPAGPQGEQGLAGPAGADGTDGQDGADGAPGVVQSVEGGTDITVDASDPANPVVNYSGGA